MGHPGNITRSFHVLKEFLEAFFLGNMSILCCLEQRVEWEDEMRIQHWRRHRRVQQFHVVWCFVFDVQFIKTGKNKCMQKRRHDRQKMHYFFLADKLA